MEHLRHAYLTRLGLFDYQKAVAEAYQAAEKGLTEISILATKENMRNEWLQELLRESGIKYEYGYDDGEYHSRILTLNWADGLDGFAFNLKELALKSRYGDVDQLMEEELKQILSTCEIQILNMTRSNVSEILIHLNVERFHPGVTRETLHEAYVPIIKRLVDDGFTVVDKLHYLPPALELSGWARKEDDE